MDHRADFPLGQKRSQFVPVLGVDDKLVPRAVAVRADAGQADAGVRNAVQIPGGDLVPLCVHLVQMGQLHPKQPRLQLVQTAVGPHHVEVVADTAAVVAEGTEFLRQPVVIRQDAATVAESAQPLGGVKAEAAHIAEGAQRFPVKMSAVGLRAVFDHPQVMLPGDFHYPAHIAAHAVKVYGHNRLCAGRDGRFDFFRVQIVIFVRFHENRRCASLRNAHHTGDVGVGADDDFVSRADVQKMHAHPQRVQPVGQPHAVLRAHIRGKFFFEILHLPAQNIPAAAEYLQGFLLVLGCVEIIHPFQIIGNDFHGRFPFLCRPSKRL